MKGHKKVVKRVQQNRKSHPRCTSAARRFSLEPTTTRWLRNASGINQGTNEDDSQNDPHPEASLFHGQREQNFGTERDYDNLINGTLFFGSVYAHGSFPWNFLSWATVNNAKKIFNTELKLKHFTGRNCKTIDFHRWTNESHDSFQGGFILTCFATKNRFLKRCVVHLQSEHKFETFSIMKSDFLQSFVIRAKLSDITQL